MKKVLCMLLCAVMLLAAAPVAMADVVMPPENAFEEETAQEGEASTSTVTGTSVIVCLGADLSEEQENAVWNMLGLDKESVKVIRVYIEDERELLGSYISAEKIGSRSISSICIETLPSGSGLTVETSGSITWVTAEMYLSALATAGVKDAHVKVVSPANVSGTAALAGIFKAYETTAEGAGLSDEAKDVASEELVTAGELGEVIGKEEAAELIAQVKQQIIELGLDDPEQIRQIIEQACKEMGITLTDGQIQQLVDLMIRISKLEIDPQELADTLNGAFEFWNTFKDSSLFAQLKEWFTQLFQWLVDFFSAQ